LKVDKTIRAGRYPAQKGVVKLGAWKIKTGCLTVCQTPGKLKKVFYTRKLLKLQFLEVPAMDADTSSYRSKRQRLPAPQIAPASHNGNQHDNQNDNQNDSTMPTGTLKVVRDSVSLPVADVVV
jgi:hypothetical protein